MAVENSLAKKRTQMYHNAQTAAYEINGQKIELTPEIVRNYMVSGNKENVSFEEIIMFMNLCKYSGLNPWAKEAYCIKYGNEPATMVVGKEAYMKRAEQNDSYDGFEAGITVLDPETGEISRRTGSFRLKGEEIVGGWAKVWRKDRAHCYESEVSFDEYAGRKRDGSLNGQWSKKPATMIRKVALVQALREAFPASLGGMYTEEEGEFTPEYGAAMPMTIERPQQIEQHETMPDTFSQSENLNPEPEPAEIHTTIEAPDGQQSFF